MTDDSVNKDDARLMRALIDEARAESHPEIDWPSVERRIGQRIALSAAWRRMWRSESGTAASMRRVTALAAAAAAVALLIASQGPEAGSLRPTASTHVARPSDGVSGPMRTVRTNAAGSVLRTGADTRRVDVPDVGSWELAPNSLAVIRQTAEPYVLALESGSVMVEVTPRPEEGRIVESFAVEVGQTRVAVHGTAFSVTRFANTVQVEVLRGTVAVGPSGNRGITVGRLLVAPARAEFSLDGGRQARLLPPSSAGRPDGQATVEQLLAERRNPTPPVDEQAVASLQQPQAARSPASQGQRPNESTTSGAHEAATTESSTAAEVLPTPSTPELPMLTAADARAHVAGCLRAVEEGSGGSGVKVTISTAVTLHRGSQDKVGSVQFNPPLRPDLQQRCAGPLLGRRLAGSERAVSFSVVVTPP